MSLIAARLQSLIYDAKDELDRTQVDDIAAILRATGRYNEPTEATRDVLAVIAVLSGPDADNARYLTGRAR